MKYEHSRAKENVNLEVSLNSMIDSPGSRVSLKFSIQLPLARLPASPLMEETARPRSHFNRF